MDEAVGWSKFAEAPTPLQTSLPVMTPLLTLAQENVSTGVDDDAQLSRSNHSTVGSRAPELLQLSELESLYTPEREKGKHDACRPLFCDLVVLNFNSEMRRKSSSHGFAKRSVWWFQPSWAMLFT